jgi:hypothetical protein
MFRQRRIVMNQHNIAAVKIKFIFDDMAVCAN